jgi:hypothetical protein
MFEAKPVVAVRTIHEMEIQWTWADSHLHDHDYRTKVNDAVDAEVKRLCAASETLVNDTSYCCQCEGIQLTTPILSEAQEAGVKIARVLARFKFLEFI